MPSLVSTLTSALELLSNHESQILASANLGGAGPAEQEEKLYGRGPVGPGCQVCLEVDPEGPELRRKHKARKGGSGQGIDSFLQFRI